VPYNHETDIDPGDTLYFHHLVVMNGGQKLPGYDNKYVVFYNPESTINSQTIAYKKKGSDKVIPMSGWAILSAVEEEEDLKSDIIELVSLTEKDQVKGLVAFDSPEVKELGLEINDVVGFAKNMDYRFKIDNVEYYRVRSEDLLYVEEK
jgi:co-chaperonin GroES (HSP10)